MKSYTHYKGILILLTCIILVNFFGIYFLFKGIQTKNEHISILKNNMTGQFAKQNYLISTKRIIESISADIERVNNSIVASDGDVAFIENIESLARNDGVEINIESLSFNDGKDKNSQVINFNIRAVVRGGWSDTYKFISKIESLPVKVKINSLNLSAVNHIWESSMELSVLKYK